MGRSIEWNGAHEDMEDQLWMVHRQKSRFQRGDTERTIRCAADEDRCVELGNVGSMSPGPQSNRSGGLPTLDNVAISSYIEPTPGKSPVKSPADATLPKLGNIL